VKTLLGKSTDYALDNHAQGGAYINNLIRGKMVQKKMLDRATPYHVPHSTEVSGYAPVYGGDDRFYNNIFIGDKSVKTSGLQTSIPTEITNDYVGTAHYKGYTTSLEEYIEIVHQEEGDHRRFHHVEQPVYINHNAYYNGAESFERETERVVANHFNPEIIIIEEGNAVYLSIELPEDFDSLLGEIQSTKTLGRARIVDAEFENPDGSEVIVDKDLLGEQRAEKSVLGPFANLQAGKNYIKVWG
jgi:alpha-L-arabinofuranosidase